MSLKRRTESLEFNERYADKDSRETDGIICQVAPCHDIYVPIELYASHMTQYHDHRCEECGRNLVTECLLQLHLEELHNPFTSKSNLLYGCFEQHCVEKFKCHQDRIAHLKNVHGYPDGFHFDVVRNGKCYQ